MNKTVQKATWVEPTLEALNLDLDAIATGNNFNIDGSSTNNLSRKS